MTRKKNFKFRGMILAAVFAWASTACAAETIQIEGLGSCKVVYPFLEQLEQAKVLIYQYDPDKKEDYDSELPEEEYRKAYEGRWTGRYFDFKGLKPKHRIGPHTGKFKDEKETGIYIRPLKNYEKILSFSVPRASRLVLEYGVSDTSIHEDSSDYIYLRILVGTKLLRRIRISVEPGWNKEVIDLGPITFLHGFRNMTFVLVADNEDGHDFYLNPTLI